jgi:hypothetical protein
LYLVNIILFRIFLSVSIFVMKKNYLLINIYTFVISNLKLFLLRSSGGMKNQLYFIYFLFIIIGISSCALTNRSEKKAQAPVHKTKMQELLDEQARRDSINRKNQALTDSLQRKNNVTSVKNIADVDDGLTLGLDSKSHKKAAVATDEPKKNLPTIPVPLKSEAFSTYDLKCYSVVVGSFANKSGASFWYKVLKKEHYDARIIENEQGLYRVIILTTDDLKAATASVRGIVERFPGAWLLISK